MEGLVALAVEKNGKNQSWYLIRIPEVQPEEEEHYSLNYINL